MNKDENTPKEKAMERLRELLVLQKEVVETFGESNYNVFILAVI